MTNTQDTETLTVTYQLDGDIYLSGDGWTQSTGLHFDADGGEWETPVADMLCRELGLSVIGGWTEHADQSVTATVHE